MAARRLVSRTFASRLWNIPWGRVGMSPAKGLASRFKGKPLRRLRVVMTKVFLANGGNGMCQTTPARHLGAAWTTKVVRRLVHTRLRHESGTFPRGKLGMRPAEELQ